MAPDSFHQFSFLPFELRRMIYLFASPPRFVDVQEHHEDREDFEDRFGYTPVQVKLHPSIAYFARNWRNRLPSRPAPWRSNRHHQSTLDTYGFGCPRPKHQPWESTKEVPGISHHYISDNHDIAWEFVRSGSFYSAAPIPPLLHVTRESRQVLIDYGYELAFRTRTCGPQVWFNFKIDILYIGLFQEEWRDYSLHFLLSGNKEWDIGQFDPLDLNKVRRLALGSSGHVVSPSYPNGAEDISSILGLFTNIEELFLEEAGFRNVSFGSSVDGRLDGSELWCHTPPLEIDALSSPFEYEDMVHSTGPDHRDLKSYKEDNMGDGSSYFVDRAHIFEEKLTSRRDELVLRDSLTPWKIPELKIVYIGYPSSCRKLFKWRWKSWNRFQDMRDEQARSAAKEEAQRSIDVPKRPLYHIRDAPPSPFVQQFQDDMDALEETLYYDYEYHGGSPHTTYDWIFTGTMDAPRTE